MDNNFGIYNGEYAGEGPIDYLNFYLVRTNYSLATGEAYHSNRDGYFSLKLALCTMLYTPPELIDPKIAFKEGITDYQQLTLFGRSDLIRLAAYEYVKPNHNEWAIQTPGIYLRTEIGSDQLRIITGIPFPNGDLLQDSKMIPLATYSHDFQKVTHTPFYEPLQKYAIAYMDRISEDVGNFPYQLTFKGKYNSTQSKDDTSVKPNLYIEQHYYNNAREPVLALLQTNIFEFEHISGTNERPKIHYHGYVLEEQEDTMASIKVMGIENNKTSDLTAGIYLFAEPNIATLEQKTTINLKGITEYEGQGNFLRLATYFYNKGIFLKADELIKPVLADLVSGKHETGQILLSPYCVETVYHFDEKTHPAQPFKTASDHYHCDIYEHALYKLLHTDWSLLVPSPNTSVGYHIHETGIYGFNRHKLASLQLYQETEMPHPTWRVDLILDVHETLSPEQMFDISKLEVSWRTMPGKREFMNLPIATLDENGEMSPIDNILPWLLNLVGYGESYQENQANAASISDKSSTTDNMQDVYTLSLEWRHPPTNPATPNTFQHITIHDLAYAHLLLQMLNPESFIPGNSRHQGAHLLRAYLLEGASKQGQEVGQPYSSGSQDPVNIDNILVTRFYQHTVTPQMPIGFYYQYNSGHPDAIKLAQEGKRFTTIQNTEGQLLVFAESHHISPPYAENQRRQILRLDDKNKGPVQKL